MSSHRRIGIEILESPRRRSRHALTCMTLAIVLFSTVFLCHLINSMESCYDASAVFTVCMVIVAIISEAMAVPVTAAFREPIKTAILVTAPALRRFGIYGLSPPHIRQASFLTPLRI